MDNEWPYVAPQPKGFNILYSKEEPSNIEIAETGKLNLQGACKASGSRVLIETQTIKTYNNTEKDIIPPLSLEYDCCVRRKNYQIKQNSIRISFEK